MLGLAKRVGAKFLLASTSEVYGDPEVHPQPETYYGNVNPIGPRFAEPYSSSWPPKKTFDTNLDYSFTKLIFYSPTEPVTTRAKGLLRPWCLVTHRWATSQSGSLESSTLMVPGSCDWVKVYYLLSNVNWLFSSIRMNMNDGRVASNFIYQALQKQPITIYGDGSQTRSFQVLIFFGS